MTSKSNTVGLRDNKSWYTALNLRFMILALAATISIGCVSTSTRGDLTHVVARGEDMKAISLKYTGTTENDRKIAERNGIADPLTIKEGDTLTIPANLVSTTAPDASQSSGAETDVGRTMVEGALVGGTIGFLSCRNCATIGALAGLAAGGAVAATKQSYVSEEERLNQEIAHAQKFNRELQSHNLELTSEVNRLSDESKGLRQRVQRGKSKISQLSAQKERVAGLLTANRKLLSDSRTELGRQEKNYLEFKTGKTATNPNTAKYQGEIAVLKTNIGKLDEEVRKLAAIDDRLSA